MTGSLARTLVGPIVAGLVLVTSCSSASSGLLPAGTSCASDADCGLGLSCLVIGVSPPDGGACTVLTSACSKTCQSNSDCTAVGPGFFCFLCNGVGSCAQTR
jgi:hypothetical protein